MRDKVLEDVIRKRQEEQMQQDDLFLPGASARCSVCRTALIGRGRHSRMCDECEKKASGEANPEESPAEGSETTEPKSS